jgi:hypothetical protein
VDRGWQPFGVAKKPLFEATLDRWSATSVCQDYDYFPQGGIQNFWCHRPEDLDMSGIESMAGVPIFSAGPHRKGKLELNARHDFGRYNPEFVRWLTSKAAPASRESAVRQATQGAYDANLKPLAELFWRVHEKMTLDDACFQREKTAYERGIKARTLPTGYYERWFFFMNPFFCEEPSTTNQELRYYNDGFDGGFDGNVVKSIVGFWLRRSIDGTRDTLASGLKQLIAAYHPALIAAPLRVADARALRKLLKDAEQEAKTCAMTHRSTGATHVSFGVTPEGKLQLTPSPQNRPVELVRCLERAWAPLSMPPFSGNPIPFNRNF